MWQCSLAILQRKLPLVSLSLPSSPTCAIITMSLAQLSSPRLRARDEQVPEPALKSTV